MSKRNALPVDEVSFGLGDGEGWESVNAGLGDSWPIDEEPLVGFFIGSQSREVPDPNNPGSTRLSMAYQFAPIDDPHSVVFVWGSAQLDAALKDAIVGDKYRIDFTGERSYNDKATGQPRRVKTYSVRHAIAQS